MENFSILRNASEAPRPFHIALAHSLAAAKVGDYFRQNLLVSHYRRLSWADRQKCAAELARCRAAQRGRIVAEIAK